MAVGWNELDGKDFCDHPTSRYAHAMAFDADRGQVVMFGGVNVEHNTYFNDTWVWPSLTPHRIFLKLESRVACV